MPKASSLGSPNNLSFLFKGPPGFYKTCAACSFAVLGPIHLSYFDKKTPIELEHYFTKIVKRPELLDNIDYDSFGSGNIHEYLNKIFDWQAKGCRYMAVITDSLTTITSAAVNWSLAFREPGRKDDKNNKMTKLIPDWDEYKVETSLVVQALDVLLELPTNVIWTAHPLPQLRLEGSGRSVKVTKTDSLVTYGSKVSGMVPGRFTEIYHFGRNIDYSTNPTTKRAIVMTDSSGDEFAKTALDLPSELDITNRLFYEVWKEEMIKRREVSNEVKA